MGTLYGRFGRLLLEGHAKMWSTYFQAVLREHLHMGFRIVPVLVLRDKDIRSIYVNYGITLPFSISSGNLKILYPAKCKVRSGEN